MSQAPDIWAVNEAKPRPRWWDVLWRLLSPFVGLLVVMGVFVGYQFLFKPDSTFLSGRRMQLVAKQTAIVGVGALGMTVIIVAGGIDLSAGSILALTAVILALVLRSEVPAAWGEQNPELAAWWLDWRAVCAVPIVLAAGLLVGAVNGLLITTLRLVPFIVTLGTMLVYRGLAEWLSNQNKVQAPAPDWLARLLDPPTADSWLLVCPGVWIVVGLALVLSIVLRYSVFGRYVFAVGSNEATARLCGVRVPRIKLAVYALGGAFMALGGIFSFSNLLKQGDPTAGLGLELDIIAAVVIGGGSLSGGRGSVLGSLIGAVTMTMLRNGCVYAGVSDPIQKVVIGAIIISAVAIDQLAHRESES
jgi:ribose/xylose/arabinose/galactoside ABC-type transport system permease subunit